LFRETVTIQNVADSTQNRDILLKAEVLRAPLFQVTPESGKLHFGVVTARPAHTERIVVTNISQKTRKFEIVLLDRENSR
jgi:hypothetical protein